MAENEITLRGHHLLNLYHKCFEKEDIANFEKHFAEDLEGEKELEEFCKKSGKGIGEVYLDFLDDLSIQEYSLEFTLHKNAFYKYLIQCPEKTIKVIDGFDYVCFRCPPEKKEECINMPGFLADSVIAKGFGLEINTSYKVKEVLEKVRTNGREFALKYSDVLSQIGWAWMDCLKNKHLETSKFC